MTICARAQRCRSNGDYGRQVRPRRLLERLLRGSFDNVRFADFERIVEAFGFEARRQDGSHCIFAHPDIPELLNLQNAGGQAKPYQVRQFLRLVERYALKLKEPE